MIKWIRRAKNSEIMFCSSKREWSVEFEAFINSKIVGFLVRVKKGYSYLISFLGSNQDYGISYYEEFTNRFNVTLQYSKVFIDAVDEISQYESQMKENLKISDVRILGKMDKENFVATFTLLSSVATKDCFPIFNAKSGTPHSRNFDEDTSFFLFFKKDGDRFTISNDYPLKSQEISYFQKLYYKFSATDMIKCENVDTTFFTHQEFLEDVLEIILQTSDI